MIWWNTLFGWGLGCVISWTHFLRGKWQNSVPSASPDKSELT